tara:strand:+ start:2092 stop:2253 length:162 start_codon:yes stop_codon:yes gene_type:complete
MSSIVQKENDTFEKAADVKQTGPAFRVTDTIGVPDTSIENVILALDDFRERGR